MQTQEAGLQGLCASSYQRGRRRGERDPGTSQGPLCSRAGMDTVRGESWREETRIPPPSPSPRGSVHTARGVFYALTGTCSDGWEGLTSPQSKQWPAKQKFTKEAKALVRNLTDFLLRTEALQPASVILETACVSQTGSPLFTT